MEYCGCKNFFQTNLILEKKHVFSGSLCRIRQFQPERYCLTIFSLGDKKHLHFSHEEYFYLIENLYNYILPKIISLKHLNNPNDLLIEQLILQKGLKIDFEKFSLHIGPITLFGLVYTAPFLPVLKYECNEKWDICICGLCDCYKRLLDFEAELEKPIFVENIIF